MKRVMLPLIHRRGSRSHVTCEYRCGNACDKPVPNKTDNQYLGDIIQSALTRRNVLKGSAAGALVLSTGSMLAGATTAAADSTGNGAAKHGGGGGGGGFKLNSLKFDTVPPNNDDKLTVPQGFQQAVIVSWGDPIVPGAPAFDLDAQTPKAQEGQFGYNCDYVAVMPLEHDWSYERALLVVNNEYTNENNMFAGWTNAAAAPIDQLKIAQAAHGLSVVEIERVGKTGRWTQRKKGSRRYNRRVTGTTKIQVTGPAAGHALLKTAADPSGRWVKGTIGNCSGGITPYGTTLHGEENFNGYFEASGPVDGAYEAAFKRYGLPMAVNAGRSWARVDERWDLARNPNEANRFGWIVELDPYDADAAPRKRTMLGRMKHEGATTTLSKDGHLVAYTGDDERFDYLYKFVSTEKFRRGHSRRDREHNLSLLDHGTLYVARFLDEQPGDTEYDGIGEWIPLTSDQQSYVDGFTVAEVLINTRLAADKVGPTKMDRPEDVERNPVNGSVYIACTNNTARTPAQVDEANPRPANKDGHIIELDEAGGDAASDLFRWRIFLVCGDPTDPSTYFGGYDKSKVSPISCPDNVAFDKTGNLWISTDGNTLGSNDGFFAVPTKGPERGHVKQFLTVPVEAETCGPWITDDQRTAIVAVQHPGEDGSVAEPTSHWPFGGVPRPSVACVWKD